MTAIPRTVTRFDHLGRSPFALNTDATVARDTPVADPSKPTISGELYDQLTNDQLLDPQDLEQALDAARRGDMGSVARIVDAAHARLAPMKKVDEKSAVATMRDRLANAWKRPSREDY